LKRGRRPTGERVFATPTRAPRAAADAAYLDVLLCAGDVSNRDRVVEET
jgi:hypothetical protein